MTEYDERVKDFTDNILGLLDDEDPENFTPEARRIALELALVLGEEQCQTLYHFAVLVTRMAR
jgi:hypothetical protein